MRGEKKGKEVGKKRKKKGIKRKLKIKGKKGKEDQPWAPDPGENQPKYDFYEGGKEGKRSRKEAKKRKG